MIEKIKISAFTKEIEFETIEPLKQDVYIPLKYTSPKKTRGLVLKITKEGKFILI